MIDTSALAIQITEFLEQPDSVTLDQAMLLLEQAMEAIEQLNTRILIERARANLMQAEIDVKRHKSNELGGQK